MSLLSTLLLGYAGAAFVMVPLHLAYRTATLQRYMISDDPHRSVDDAKLHRDAVINSTLSMSLIFAISFGLQEHLFLQGSAAWWVLAIEASAVLFIYDFSYYFVHRYPFHEWKMLRGVHAVHHAARNPRTIDSLLLHPIETMLGLALLFGSIALVGGIHLATFAPLFFVYTTLNVLNHAGINIPHFPFRTLGILAEKHDKHHHSMLSGNYASITPIPDLLFGTSE